jgi:hypothetical protein
MRTPDGRWRVEQIIVRRELTRLRVSTFGSVFVAEVTDVEQRAASRPLHGVVEVPGRQGGVGYRTVWNMFTRIAGGSSSDERAVVFHGTARCPYRI